MGSSSNTYLHFCGYHSLSLLWVAFRQADIGNDHIHVVVAERSFAGRQIYLERSQAETDNLQKRLAAAIHMNEPRLFDPRNGVSTEIRSTTKKGRLPENAAPYARDQSSLRGLARDL